MEFPASFDLRSVDTDGDGIGDRCYVTPVRAQYPAAVPGHYEVGDTAYLTLDNFSYMFGADHYALTETDELPIDTFGQVIRAHRQIRHARLKLTLFRNVFT